MAVRDTVLKNNDYFPESAIAQLEWGVMPGVIGEIRLIRYMYLNVNTFINHPSVYHRIIIKTVKLYK